MEITPSSALSPQDPIAALARRRPQIRRRLIDLHYQAKVGHLGGNLSCLDILLVLFARMDWARDRFILSKGHSAGALYTALWSAGRMTDEELRNFHRNESPVGGHPSPFFKPEIPFFTGSLGHGLGLAAGVALARRLRGQSGDVYALLSDGEWQEGSTWEALNFAFHHDLGNLKVLVDFNGLQGFGSIEETLSMRDLPRRVAAMGVRTRVCPGHDLARIHRELGESGPGFEVLFFETVKGQGISFMADTVDWHYWTLDDEKYRQALIEIDLEENEGRGLA